MINGGMSDEVIRKELGQRLQSQRLQKNLDQEALAWEAGISSSTLYRLEKGGSVSFEAYLKVLRVLGLLSRLDDLIPEHEISPIQRVKDKKATVRQRASGSRKSANKKTSWKGFKQQVHFED